MLDIEKVNSYQGCGKCIFCLSKCPKCGTPNIAIQYHKQYSNSNTNSFALVRCECSKNVISRRELPKSFGLVDGKPQYIEEASYKMYYVPELTKCIDELFKGYKANEEDNFEVIYELNNDTDNRLRLNFEEVIGDVTIDLPDSIICNVEEERKDKHQKINVFESRIR
jgi:hypothetical protein